MKRIIMAAAGVLALAGGAVRATDDKSAAGANAPGKETSSSATTGTAGTTATGNTAAGTSTAGTSASSTDLPAVGDVKATDPGAMVITIVLQSGDEQKLNVANDATITRDGDKASLGQLQPGDNVRASFDPSSHKVSKVDVRSKSSKATGEPTKSKSNDSSKSDDAQKK